MIYPRQASLVRAARLAKLALQFGRVERITLHEDGLRPETDTDHTVMLALIACDFAPEGLNRGRIAEFAIVHDLVETYADDTQTLTITPGERALKHAREEAGKRRVLDEFGAESWLGRTLMAYEAQQEPEAQFVRVMDKVMPKLTHTFNACMAAKSLVDYEGFVAAHERQYAELTAMYSTPSHLDSAFTLFLNACTLAESAWTETPAPE